ncbi:MAG: GNAT family N-acetyltransferase [Acidimicrobiia bacterium]
MEVTRRAAEDSDTDFARETHHRAYRDVVTRQFGAWNEDAQDAYFGGDWLSGPPFEIALADGRRCGYLSVEKRSDEIHVRELVLHPDFQNQGIGTALLRQEMERAQAAGLPVRLQTQLKNEAIRLYRRLGFNEVGRTETHFQLEWLPTK